MKHPLRSVIGVTLLLLLSACGNDGGDGEPAELPELSGVFQAGNVRGVHYRTQTRDGLTDASGTFKYLAGETVTFSVGAIRLGSAPAATTITPFTLAGLAPPTTELALRRELDRATRTTSAFVRAVNIQRFLLALDADHDPANGIDVRSRTSALANASLDFTLRIPMFTEKLDKLSPGLTHNMPSWFPIVHLYRALGIVVPTHAQVTTDTNEPSFSPFHAVMTYYPDGSRKSQESHDAFDTSVYIQTNTYDPFGRRTTTRFVNQLPYSGGHTENERWIFDSSGTLTGSARDRDEGNDGSIEYSSSVTHEYDEFNNLLRQLTRNDMGDDGTIDSLSDFQAAYDSHMNNIRTVSENDLDGNGAADSRWIQTAEYDAGDRLVSRLSEFDENADGTVDSRETTAITYTSQDLGAVETYRRDNDADGVVDYALTYRWTYDAGRLRTLEILVEPDFDEAGHSTARLLQTRTYDDDARVLTEVQEQDWDGVAGFETTSRTAYTYADFGSPLRLETEVDGGNDGQIDYRYTFEYQYGPNGELLGLEDNQSAAPQWTSRVTTSTQITNTLMPDGVLALAQQYFEFAYSLYVDGAVAF